MKFTLPTITMLCALVASVVATPIHIARDVYDPPITSPDANTVWTVNTTQTVTWDTSDPPTQITNPIGSIMLRKNGFTVLTLAKGFDILLGEFEVIVPDVPESNEYILVLMGDSGNWSPEFTITGGTSA
ncbi:hypothetical protein IW261DRAFT_1443900 [Armillaria novae-zelandiae]|uniref:Yeast cell wall synthesis Kre9/Knh1-like N-terminal domain-containing protein n=1 Tax=Armillaria novae-zelandiae TaxID=153914 RepID=A0AA39PRW4_9AGAR|nr:hypothetical protein IW261DRAFT_1443900 [Armillaria novae-zelandiae]